MTPQPESPDNEMAKYLREKEAVFTRLDKAEILAFANKYRIFMPTDTDEIFWAAVHKMRAVTFGLSPEIRKESEDWLREHGHRIGF